MKRLFLLIILSLFSIEHLKAEIYAVIVGVSENSANYNELRYADDDAVALYNYLVNFLSVPTGNITMLLDSLATKNKVIMALNTQFSKASEEDIVMFFFSGHGVDSGFTCYNSMLTNNHLKHSDVKRAFSNCKSKMKICFADACFSGGLKPNVAKQKIYGASNNSLNEGSLLVMLSSRSTEYSEENRAVKQGWFTYFLLLGMQGKADANKDGMITILELYSYVRSGVRLNTKNRQTPIAFGRFNNDDVLVSIR